jgi:phospholipid/cholesterol/gamma-HCH transport system substrate-binding protein
MMESKANYAFVGLFVILLGMALVASILWLSVGIEKKSYQTYQVYIQESVSGLNKKAYVKYRGVEVGYVRDIALVPERPNEVLVLLDIEQGVPLKQDTLALLSIQGLTGLAYVELTGGSLEALPPVRKPEQDYPELKTQPSLFVRLDTGVSDLLDNLNNVSKTANHFLSNLDPETTDNLITSIANLSQVMTVLVSEENSTAVTNILHNIEVVTQTLADRTDSIEQALNNVIDTTENINKVSDKVIALLTQLEKTLAAIEESSQAFAQIAKAIENTSTTFTETSALINQVVLEFEETTRVIAKTAKNVSFAVKESRQDMDYFTRQALPEMTNSLRELQLLLNTLRHFAKELERKPNMLLFGK